MKSKKSLIIPLFSFFFVGLFIPNELFKSLSYLGPAVFFLLSVHASDFHFKKLFSPHTIWIGLFFLLHIVAITYSENFSEATRFCVLRLPLLLVPPFLYYSRFLKNNQRKRIEFTYATICIVAGLIGLLYRLYYISYIDNNINWLYNDNLVSIYGLQAVYFGVYLTIASLFLTRALLDKEQKRKWLICLALVFTTVFIFLLASRTSLILYFLVNFLVVLYIGFKRSKKIIPIFAGILAVLLLVMFFFFPATVKRFKSVANTEFTFDRSSEYYHFGEELDESQWNGLNSRLAMWTAAVKTMENQWILGSGTGDKQDELRKTYKALGFNLGLEKNFGTHNQYLEILIMFGIIGLTIIFISFFLPLTLYFREGNIISTLIILSFMLAFVTEDFLGRNQGVALFAFFYAYCAAKPSQV